jgi:bifunctional non-homologous end joining protein LigD
MSKPKGTPSDRLSAYRKKRSAGATPEPYSETTSAASRPRLFVVQKHDATRLHFDLRLEWGGTLLSWAVPRGFSRNPKDQRLAVHVEDHPVEYADFEGLIPKGNYGAGAVIVWDRGYWVPLDDPDAGLERGILHFELRGYKLRGVWLLVRTGKEGNEWLLRKKPDAWAIEEAADEFPEESILSGLRVEELHEGRTRAAEVRSALEALGAPQKAVDPRSVSFMLAETADAPFTSKDWIFELKFDGYRVLASRSRDGQPLLLSRNGHDMTATFPDVARPLRALPYEGVVLDAELVVFDADGKPSFESLQKRSQIRRRIDIEHATITLPVTLQTFDLLAFEGFDLRALPLVERKRLLGMLVPKIGPVRYTDHIAEVGEAMYAKVQEMGLEGIMGKEAASTYRGGRSAKWQKIPTEREGDFVIVGFTRPKGARDGFGALHLAGYDGKVLRYAGRVGTGFNDALLKSLGAALDARRRPRPAFEGNVLSSDDHGWVEPELVALVRYKTWTEQGMLRHPVFVRLREDKPASECSHPAAANAVETEALAAPAPPDRVEKTVKLTRLSKVFWPKEGYTKGQLIEYYRTVSPWLLPYLKDRPLVLTRYPDGIEGESFYQKNAPDFVPDWIQRVSIWSSDTEKDIDYFVCNDVETLVYVANSASIPLHIWPSRVGSLQNPDWCIVDLDPKGAPFEHVVELALAVRALGEEIELETFVKTSGSSGLHVLIPLGGQCTFDQSRMLAQLLSRVIEGRRPDIATTTRVISARQGKVYLDFLQNRHGQLLVAPYSVRPLPGAPVSAPLEWKEVTKKLGPQAFTIENLPARLAKKKRDPLAPLLTAKPDLVAVLERLAERLG